MSGGKRVAALALGVAAVAALLGAVLFVAPALQTAADAGLGEQANGAATPANQAATRAAATAVAATANDAQVAAASCLDELAELDNNPTLVGKRRDIAVAKFSRESGLHGLAWDLAEDLAGLRGTRATAEAIYQRQHPQATSPPLARQRRLALGPLLESVALGKLVWGWESDFQAARLTLGDREIAEAIRRGVSAEVLGQLIDLSGVSPAFTNRDGTSLATAAAIYGKPKLLRWLVERGATPIAGGSVLDDIALLPASENDDTYAAVVAQLVALGDRPRMPTTLPVLAKRFPQVARATLTLHPDAAAALQRPEVQQAAEGLRSLLAEWNARVEAADEVHVRCASKIASEAAVRTRPSLANKQRYEDALRKALVNDPGFREGLEALAQFEGKLNTGDIPNTLRALRLMMDLWDEEHYVRAIEIAEEWDLGYHFVLEEALRNGVPLPVVHFAIERAGGMPPKNAILVLAERPWPGAAELARVLIEDYGMDPHFVDENGRNAHDLLSTRFYRPPELARGGLNAGAWELAHFLAEHDVSVKPRRYGFDPPDNVLRTGLDTPLAWPGVLAYSRFLIDRGALVERSHLELAQLIAEENPERHRLLVDAVPELAASASR